jgi:hypothetical protein
MREASPMTERQKETRAGVLLTALVIGLLLGAYLLLRVVTNVDAIVE